MPPHRFENLKLEISEEMSLAGSGNFRLPHENSEPPSDCSFENEEKEFPWKGVSSQCHICLAAMQSRDTIVFEKIWADVASKLFETRCQN